MFYMVSLLVLSFLSVVAMFALVGVAAKIKEKMSPVESLDPEVEKLINEAVERALAPQKQASKKLTPTQRAAAQAANNP
jgi:hypothetical protein